HHLVLAGGRAQRGNGEFRRTGKDDFHGAVIRELVIGDSKKQGYAWTGRSRGNRSSESPITNHQSPLSSHVLALLGQLLAHHLALERGQVVDEQLAVQVVHLVLDAGGQQA